jgi:hypothetical protein
MERVLAALERVQHAFHWSLGVQPSASVFPAFLSEKSFFSAICQSFRLIIIKSHELVLPTRILKQNQTLDLKALFPQIPRIQHFTS